MTCPLLDESYDDVPQLDGNISILSESLSDDRSNVKEESIFSFWYGTLTIPVVVNLSFQNRGNPPPWFEEYYKRKHMKPVRKTVIRNNKLSEGQILPKISVSNMRSLFPKVNGYKNDLIQREIGLSLLSEVWEKKGKRKHNNEIEKMLQMEGLKYISTPRPSRKGEVCVLL